MMTDFDKILGTKTEPKESAPTQKSKKTAKKAAAPSSVPEHNSKSLNASGNDLPLAPVQDGKAAGDAGYNYYAATNDINTKITELKGQIDELVATNRALNDMRVKATKVLTHAEANEALQRQNRRIQGEADKKAAKIAAVLKEMGLN
jgi:predicted glycoside hydrolase/deacetylase ChbG (UPF0249 family)